jgi:LysM repeat protein
LNSSRPTPKPRPKDFSAFGENPAEGTGVRATFTCVDAMSTMQLVFNRQPSCYLSAMKSLRFAILPVFASGLVACASKADSDQGYDTSNPYGVPSSGNEAVAPSHAADPAMTQSAGANVPLSNPVYDTPAAYEENTGSRKAPPVSDSAIVDPGVAPGTPRPATQKPGTGAPVANPSAEASNVALSGTIHTVGKGDSLWAIGKKYGVSVDSLKKANGLTKDTVVIGQKLQIPVR